MYAGRCSRRGRARCPGTAHKWRPPVAVMPLTKLIMIDLVSQRPNSSIVLTYSYSLPGVSESTDGIAKIPSESCSDSCCGLIWIEIQLEQMLTTQVTALRCPTKSWSHFQPSRSIICAVGPPPFMACADTRYWPSGDHDNRNTCVVPGQSTNGSVIVCWQPQSEVRHIRTLRSSLCEARNLPTYEQNSITWESSLTTISCKYHILYHLPGPM